MATSTPASDSTAANAPALDVQGLRYAFPGASRDTISVPSLTIGRGEQVLLAGASGSGKSTLLNLIAGLIDPTGGAIKVAGRDIHRLTGASRDAFRGKTIGMVFQTFNLLQGFSAIENVMLALMFSDVPRNEHHARASELLKRLGIDRVDAEPSKLSVGQQQRVAVARAVACRPALVLADEPTASLDPANARAAMSIIQQACADNGAALLCVSHDPAIRERFTRVETIESISSSAGVPATAGAPK